MEEFIYGYNVLQGGAIVSVGDGSFSVNADAKYERGKLLGHIKDSIIADLGDSSIKRKNLYLTFLFRNPLLDS